jgi:hypothetical protein
MRPELYAPDTEWKRRTLGGCDWDKIHCETPNRLSTRLYNRTTSTNSQIDDPFYTYLAYGDGIARNKGNRIKLICAYIARRLQ